MSKTSPTPLALALWYDLKSRPGDLGSGAGSALLRRRVSCTPLCCVCAPTTPARPPLLRHLNSVPSRSGGLLCSGSAYHAWSSMIIVHRTLGRRLLPPRNPVAPHVAHRPLCVRAQRLQAWGGGSRAILARRRAASGIPPLTPPSAGCLIGIPPMARCSISASRRTTEQRG